MQQLEAIAANVNDLQDGEMQQVFVGETEVLLTRLDRNSMLLGLIVPIIKHPLPREY